jgi:hypothetical protein
MREDIRKALAIAGCILWLTSSLTPLFGGIAKHSVRCRGREFTGEFDDCFNDYMPVLELLAPVLVLALLWFFARFAFSCWAPEPHMRNQRWRLAPADGSAVYYPAHMVLACAGCAWALWRAMLYSFDPVTLPYLCFWLVFAVWFAASALAASGGRLKDET